MSESTFPKRYPIAHPTRRGFLTTAGITAAAASMPQMVTAQKSDQKKLRIGIIGCGGRANNVGDMARKDGRFEVAALADYFQSAVDEKGNKFKVPANRRFTGINCFKKMIEAGGIDICAVLSPPYFHPEQVEAAVEAGLHIWLAKPIAVDASGVARIEAAAKKAASKSRCFLVDFQTRAFPHYHEAAKHAQNGDMGTLGWGEIEGTCPAFGSRSEDKGPEGKLKNWLQWKDLCGESLVEFSIHSIDMASLILGRAPISASGQCGRYLLDRLPGVPPSDVQDHWLVTYDYGDGLKVMFRGKRFDGHGLPDHHGIYVKLHGSEGSLSADYSGEVIIMGKKRFYGDRFMKEKGFALTKDNKFRGLYNKGISANWNTFHDNIRQGDFSQATVAPSVQSHYLALLAREAGYAKGKTVMMEDVIKSQKTMSFDISGLKS